jgi:uncharacterized repeat protein (TIGR02543 family)
MAKFRNSLPPARAGSPRPVRRLVFTRRGLAAAIGLALASGSLPAVAAESGPQVTVPDSAVELFAPAAATHARTLRAEQARVGREAVRLNRAITRLPLQGRARFSLPRGVSYELIYDNHVDHPSGNVTWSGYLKDYGDDYRAIITFGDGGVSGRILTPDGEFLVETDADGEWLIDTQAAGLAPAGPGLDDALIPLPEQIHKRLPKNGPGAADGEGSSSGEPVLKNGSLAPLANLDEHESQATAADATPTTIDVMILYTPGLASRLGGGLSARLDQLVALSNQAYRDSGVYINLRLVHKQQVNYSDTTTNTVALNALTQGADPALTNVASLRNTYGADLVSLIRPFNYSTSGGSCGVAWIGGYGGQPVSGYASYGYSVIGDGRDVNGSNYYCPDLSFTHELGHNMGSLHDRANAGGGSGAYPYSYGYGVSGTFGTVMSYINPRVGKFSNPAITCAGGITCGISETAANSANNALSLNNTRAAVASFRGAQQTPPPPPPPPSTSYTLTVTKSGSGTVSAPGITCGNDCTEAYASGTQVTLTASPASGYVFSGWSGACTGTGGCSVTMNAARSVTAIFTAQNAGSYTLKVVRTGSGTVTSNPAGINCGSDCSEVYPNGVNVSLQAVPASGYVFGGSSSSCANNICTVYVTFKRR